MPIKTFTCVICQAQNLTKPQSFAFKNGRACRTHPEAQASRDEAAERWLALANCSRIRLLGYARHGKKGQEGNIRHIGFEFTTDQKPYSKGEKKMGLNTLVEFVDGILEDKASKGKGS